MPTNGPAYGPPPQGSSQYMRVGVGPQNGRSPPMFENLLPIGAHTQGMHERPAANTAEFICNGGSCSRRKEVQPMLPPPQCQSHRGDFRPNDLARIGGTVYSRHSNYTPNGQEEYKKPYEPTRRCVIGDTTSMAISIVATVFCCVVADVVRTTPPPATGDTVALGISTAICVSFAIRAIYKMWSQLRPTSQNLRSTLVDVASVYFLTVVAFGATFSFVGILDGLQTSWLMTNTNPGATLRVLDGIYVMTFVAAGVGLPPSRDGSFTLGLHLVTWGCSLLSTTFVGKVLIATALSVRLSHDTYSRYDEESAHDNDMWEEERRPLRRV